MLGAVLEICLMVVKFIIYGVIIFFIGGIIYTLINNKRNKIGKDFDIFKKRSIIDVEGEYLTSALKKVDGYKKIIRYNDFFLLFHERGIYLLKPLEYDNKILGNIKDEVLVNWLNAGNVVEIPNFFKQIDDLNKRLTLKIKEPIINILIKKEICILETKYSKKFNVISKTNFLYRLNNVIKNEELKYSKEDIKELINKLK